MMYLAKPSLWRIVKAQYAFKLKAHIGVFASLVAVNLLGIALSLSFSSQFGISMGQIWLSMRSISNEAVLWVTVLWAFVVAVLLTTKDYSDLDFTFVSNCISHNLSNAVLLITWSIAAGTFAALGAVLLRLVAFFVFPDDAIVAQNVFLAPLELVVGAAVSSMYMLLAGCIGYLGGKLMQAGSLLALLTPLFALAFAMLGGGGEDVLRGVQSITGFIMHETSLLLFVAKSLGTAGLIFGLAFLLSHDTEVKRQ
ncbi:MAG: hypothetical protein DDT37_00859 [Firmicutes bacterium]|nr:hypothetical protein [candidate division NPL-UPA2 bacterium]